jgi:hypothetical protein
MDSHDSIRYWPVLRSLRLTTPLRSTWCARDAQFHAPRNRAGSVDTALPTPTLSWTTDTVLSTSVAELSTVVPGMPPRRSGIVKAVGGTRIAIHVTYPSLRRCHERLQPPWDRHRCDRRVRCRPARHRRDQSDSTNRRVQCRPARHRRDQSDSATNRRVQCRPARHRRDQSDSTNRRVQCRPARH